MVKQELARIIPAKKYEQKSELLAFIIIDGLIDSAHKLLIVLDNPIMIKVVYLLIKKVYNYEAKIEIIKKSNKKKVYFITVTDVPKIRSLLREFKCDQNIHGKFIKPVMGKEEELLKVNLSQKDFLRGAFLAGGFINDPERMYHLEITCPSKGVALLIRDVLHYCSFSAKISFWQKKWTVYFKSKEQIFEFLRFIGVQRALLNLQDVIARKDILNTVNRLVNCEAANLDKTIFSASQQIFFINLVLEKMGWGKLSPNLQKVIKLRLDHPYASIQELAEISGGGITKSGIYHRLKKIKHLAEGYLPVSE